MGVDVSELLTPFLGALQASVSVLLTIYAGVLAAQFGLLSSKTSKEVSSLCVKMLLPALLISQLGAELHADTVGRYVPIIIWGIIYNAISMGLGVVTTRMFKLPVWVTPALSFNNTTSLPLLLIQALSETGIIDSILRDGDSASEAIARAKSYFLVNAMLSNSLTFALGPRLLKPFEEDAPDKSDNEPEQEHLESNGDAAGSPEAGQDEEDSQDPVDEESSLLPRNIVRKGNQVGRNASKRAHAFWNRLPPWAQETLDVLYGFVNAPIIGALIGGFIGLIPALHRVFFNKSFSGGYFNAWLTTTIENLGDLFATLQILVVGVKLSQGLQNMKNGENSGHVPWRSMSYITFVRFFIWPLISIPVIWALATKTTLLGDDPILWFALMLMPTGPPAMILTALSEVNGSSEAEKMAIAKFLTYSYALTPLICAGVVGSLKATEAAT